MFIKDHIVLLVDIYINTNHHYVCDNYYKIPISYLQKDHNLNKLESLITKSLRKYINLDELDSNDFVFYLNSMKGYTTCNSKNEIEAISDKWHGEIYIDDNQISELYKPLYRISIVSFVNDILDTIKHCINITCQSN